MAGLSPVPLPDLGRHPIGKAQDAGPVALGTLMPDHAPILFHQRQGEISLIRYQHLLRLFGNLKVLKDINVESEQGGGYCHP